MTHRLVGALLLAALRVAIVVSVVLAHPGATAVAAPTIGAADDRSVGGTEEDYRFAAESPGRIRGLVARDQVSVHWLDGSRLWYRVNLGGGQSGFEYYLVDGRTGSKSPLFDRAALAAFLAEELKRVVEPGKLPIERIDVELAPGDGAESLIIRILIAGGRAFQASRANDGVARWEPITAAAWKSLATELSPAIQRSRRAGPSIVLTFENRRAERVTIAWIDGDGRRQDYGVIEPGASRSQQTYAGHAWAIFDAKNQLIGSFIAPREASLIPVNERTGDSPGPSQPAPHSAPLPASTELTGMPASALAAAPVASVDGPPYRAQVKGFNVEVLDPDGRVVVATTDGTADRFYGEPFHWSPDGSRVLVTRRVPRERHQIHLIESSPRDRTDPILHALDYLKPGDRIEQTWPVLIDARSGQIVESTRSEAGTALYANPWSIDRIEWEPDGAGYSFLYNQRGHQALRVVRVDARTGEAKAIVNEESTTFVDYAGKFFFERLPETREILWMSERDGWNHLYLIDASNGAEKRQITRGAWVVREVDRIDRERRELTFRAGGIHPGQDPYHVHLAVVSMDGGEPRLLTQGDGTHEIEWSPDRTHYVDRWSRVDFPPVTELRRAHDGSLATELERADWSALLATGWRPPERFVAKGRDGTTDIWGALWWPTDRRTEKPGAPSRWTSPLPVIENIYAGPQSAFVPKEFHEWHGQRELAELGFVVVQIDGMGTSQRSKAFHDICWKNLKDAGFADRALWLRAAAAAHPAMDLSRVGIYGGSAGGQNALRALIDHHDTYHVAVADCGCHDNRMDKIWWNELWMGWPIDESYVTSSNVADAGKLEGKLLLTVGELDRNVDPASTMQVVDALVRANKDFDLLVLPGMGHGAGESPYGKRRRADFFVRHLMGVEPRRPAL